MQNLFKVYKREGFKNWLFVKKSETVDLEIELFAMPLHVK